MQNFLIPPGVFKKSHENSRFQIFQKSGYDLIQISNFEMNGNFTMVKHDAYNS
mgnify:CR=1 FL=1